MRRNLHLMKDIFVLVLLIVVLIVEIGLLTDPCNHSALVWITAVTGLIILIQAYYIARFPVK